MDTEHDGGAASLPLSRGRGPIRRRDYPEADQSEGGIETLKTIYEETAPPPPALASEEREKSWELNFKVRWMFVFCLNVHCILIFTDKELGLNNTNTLSTRSERSIVLPIVSC